MRRVILCSLVFAWVSVSKSQNSFFMATDNTRDNDYYCITNTSFALGWIQEPFKESLQQKSTYIPEYKSSFNCDFKPDSWCTKNYFIRPPWGLASATDQIILDERWEEMKVIKTEFVDGEDELLNFVPVQRLEIPTYNFNIFLSIRMEKEGHIFLCDLENPSKSNCYWFMLQAFNGSRSAIRKCSEEEVPSIDKVHPEKSCNKSRFSVAHPEFPFYLSSSKWSHFMLSKQERLLTFSVYADHKLMKILEWQDTETPISVTDMIVHSKMVDGLWKIHNLDFIATEKRSNDVVLGPSIYAPEGFVCISMYVSMCRTCKIKLSLANQLEREIINDMTYEAKDTGWNQIKFLTTNVSNSITMQLLVSTISESPNLHWAVDEIRFCLQEEFRMIRSTKNITCQLMSDTDDIITLGEQFVTSENTCPEDTIGPFCVKCDWIFDDCYEITICNKYQCVCSAGHRGQDCYNQCPQGSYGHGCQKTCGKCDSYCDFSDGTCSPCLNSYSGPKCDIPPSIIFVNPPEVSDITHDGATISVSDFEIANQIRDLYPHSYRVEYKKAKDPNSVWITYNMTFTFQDPAQFRINNLNSRTQYLVRSVLIVSRQWQTGEDLKYTEFTTLCQGPYDLKVHWTIQNHLVLEWKYRNESNGDIQYFDISISAVTVRNIIKKTFNMTSNLYNLTYFYQINASEFTPTEQYEVTIFAFNCKRGTEVSTTTISPPEIPRTRAIHLLNNPNDTVGMIIVLNKFQGKTDNYRIIVLRSDKESNLNFYYELQKIDLRNLRVVIDCNFTNKQNSIFVILGQNEQSNGCHSINNSLLEPATSYNVTIILMNTYSGTTSTNVYSMTIETADESNSALFALLLLLLIIPAVAFCYIKIKSIRSPNQQMLAFYRTVRQTNVERRTDRMPLEQPQPKIEKNIRNQNTAAIHESAKDYSKLVPVKTFYNYFKTSLENKELNNQHESILEAAVTYETVLFDNLRSDYVDMNFNSGLQVKNAYLTTKLPEVAEFNEFWKMVEDENVHHIILFAHLQPNQKKSTNYWPDLGKRIRYGKIVIECDMCQKYTFYTHRKFSWKCKDKIREVDQLHLSLPRNDSRYLPSLNHVEFFQKMSQIPHSCRSPILVHSSAGMSGTSFALLCDMSLRSAQIDGAIDVMTNFKTLIQTTTQMKIEFDHYVAVHAIIADILNRMDTSIACSSFDCSQLELFSKEEVQKHLHYLKDTLWLDELIVEVEKECYTNDPTTLLKDGQVVQRDISSGDHSQLKQSDFIKVGVLKTPGVFWVAKRPISMPLCEFLEKVQETNISVIVTLNDIFTWPSENQPEMVLNNDITLKYKCVKKLRSYDWITLELTTKTTRQIIEVVSSPLVALPKIADFVNFVMESSEIFQNVETVLVTCHDGVTCCGLYLAMWFIIQRIKTERVCDVCHSIRRLRRHCQDFVKDDEQYVFLLEAAHHYMKQITLYEVR